MSETTIKTAVIGNPIQHSLSPQIHNYWIKQNKINTTNYEKIKIDISSAVDEIRNLFECGFGGLNVTIPFKELAYKLCDNVDLPIQKLKAVNTIVYKNNIITGYNTDPAGFINSINDQIKNNNIIKKNSLVFGAGGSARSIIYALNKMESNITVINRTAEKVELISKDLDIPIKIKSYKEINNIISDIDLIVNTTSLGMKDNHNIEIDFDKSKANLHVYDLIYNPQQTKLLIDAEMSGCTYQNGLDMLVHQAAESFFIWHGIYPTINEEIFSIIRKFK